MVNKSEQDKRLLRDSQVAWALVLGTGLIGAILSPLYTPLTWGQVGTAILAVVGFALVVVFFAFLLDDGSED